MSTLAAQSHDPALPDVQVPKSPSSPEPLALILQATTLLFANAETTERTMAAGNRVAEALGYRATLIPQWDELTARLEGPSKRSMQSATADFRRKKHSRPSRK